MFLSHKRYSNKKGKILSKFILFLYSAGIALSVSGCWPSLYSCDPNDQDYSPMKCEYFVDEEEEINSYGYFELNLGYGVEAMITAETVSFQLKTGGGGYGDVSMFDWSSSDPTVAVVSDTGFVECKSVGSAVITATHKVTGEVDTFPIQVVYIDKYKSKNPGQDGVWFTPDDEKSSYTGFLKDANGNITLKIRVLALAFGFYPEISFDKYEYDSAGRVIHHKFGNAKIVWGNDGTLFSYDDRQSYTREYLYNSDGTLARKTTCVSPRLTCAYSGANNIFYKVYHYTTSVDHKITRIVLYTGIGPDQVLYSADDKLSGYIEQEVQLDGKIIRESGVSPGPDGIVFTVDDDLWNSMKFVYDAGGNLIQGLRSYSRGSDGIWFTGDDDYSFYFEYQYDASGRETGSAYYTGFGPDQVWFTADDIYTEKDVKVYDPAGNLVKFIDSATQLFYEYDAASNLVRSIHHHPGVDLVWDTGDEYVLYYNECVYGANLQQVIFKGSGLDGQMLTADDDIRYHVEYFYDAQGRKSRQIERNASDQNGNWLVNSNIRHYFDYIYDANGSLFTTIKYNHPGDDNIWLSGDDKIEFYERDGTFKYIIDCKIEPRSKGAFFYLWD